MMILRDISFCSDIANHEVLILKLFFIKIYSIGRIQVNLELKITKIHSKMPSPINKSLDNYCIYTVF